MLFNSFEFLLFFPVVVVFFYMIPHRYRWLWLLLASYFFYMKAEPALILLLLASTLIDYYCSLKIAHETRVNVRKRYLWTSIITNFGMLFFFKYFVFFLSGAGQILNFFGLDVSPINHSADFTFSKILLPVGISFYTFQTISYTIDVYRRKIEPEVHFGKYALYVAFFPQLVAGPIERAERLLVQFHNKIEVDTERIKRGIIMMAWGFFLKLVVADRLGVYVDTVFYAPWDYNGVPLMLGSLFFTFQIYYDFSAYCTIAIGAAEVLGYDLMQNFNRPVFFSSNKDFWRRWHISLMQWFRDYMYLPMVTKFKMKPAVAAVIVFFFTGLWHGANWTFIIWGVMCGCMLIIEIATKKWRQKILLKLRMPLTSPIQRFISWMVIFGLLNISLIFFRSQTVQNAGIYIFNMVTGKSVMVNVMHDRVEVLLCIILIVFVQLIHYYKGNGKIYELVTNRPAYVRWPVYIVLIFAIVLFGVNRQNNFIYFQF